MTHYRLLLIIFLLFSVYSCSDRLSSPPPVIYDDYLPLSEGKYFVYSYKQLDTSFSVIQGSEAIDSLVVISKISKAGKQGYLLNIFRNQQKIAELTIFNDKKSISLLNNFILDSIPDINDKWFKIFEFDTLDWTIYADFQDKINYDFYGESVTSNRHYVIRGFRKQNTDSLKIGSNTYPTILTTKNSDMKIDFKILLPSDSVRSNIEIVQLRSEQFYFSKNIGIVKWVVNPYNQSIRSDSTNKYNPAVIIKKNGWVRELISYN